MSNQQVTVSFLIEERVNYTGVVNIHTSEWERIFGWPFDPADVDEYTLRQYVDEAAANVDERDGDVQGQDWSEFKVEETIG